jgi:Tfp pilus assembly protein PilO
MNIATVILLLAMSVGSFFLYTNKEYKEIETLKKESAAYDLALEKAKEALQKKDILQEKYNMFTVEDFDQLQKMLPDTVDNIRLLLDINQVASNYGTSISGIKVDTEPANTSAGQATEAKPFGGITIHFKVSMNYENFQRFLKDIEHNLRITDITALTFGAPVSGQYAYDVTLRTYWLK